MAYVELESGASSIAPAPGGGIFAIVPHASSSPTEPDSVIELSGDGHKRPLPFKGLMHLDGIAADAAGDVFVTATSTVSGPPWAGHVVELSPDGEQRTLNVGPLTGPSSIAVDNTGHIFVVAMAASGMGNQVVELSPGNAQRTLPFTPGEPGKVGPVAVATDPSGEVFVTDLYAEHGGAIEAMSPTGTVSTVFNAFDPYALALDPAGDLFVAATGNAQIVELPSSNSTSTFRPSAQAAQRGPSTTPEDLPLRVDAPAKGRMKWGELVLEPKAPCAVSTGAFGYPEASVSGSVRLRTSTHGSEQRAVELWIVNRSGKVVGAAFPASLPSEAGTYWWDLDVQAISRSSVPVRCVVQGIDASQPFATPQRSHGPTA